MEWPVKYYPVQIPPPVYRAYTAFLYLLLATGIMLIAWHIYERILYDLTGPLNSDSPIYLAIGRGILDGLLPYKDLFETKPPGIFLLSALSLWIFDSHILANYLSAVSLFTYPLIMGYIAWHMQLVKIQWRIVLFSALLGGIFGLYAAGSSGSFQVESYATFFCLLYLLLISDPGRITVAKTLAMSLCMLAAIGMKEPFLLSLTSAVIIIYYRTPSKLYPILLIPFILTLILGVAALALFGMLEAYLLLYANIIHTHLLHSDNNIASFYAGNGIPITIRRITNNLGNFSEWMPVLVFLLGIALLANTNSHLFRDIPKTLVTLLLCCLLCIFAVGMKYYFPHHAIYAVPLYLALSISLMRRLTDNPTLLTKSLGLLIMVVAVVTTSTYQSKNYDKKTYIIDKRLEKSIKNARMMDIIMDSCGHERYLYIGHNGIKLYGFTRHLPLGPAFIQYSHYLIPSQPYLRQTFINNLRTTPIIYVDSFVSLGRLQSFVINEIQENFSEIPPECAGKTRAARKLKNVYYRKSSDDSK
jgi:hypothetical protein